MTAQLKRLAIAAAVVVAAICLMAAPTTLRSPPQGGDSQSQGGWLDTGSAQGDGDAEAPADSAVDDAEAVPEDAALIGDLFERAGGAQVKWGMLPDSFSSEVFDPEALGVLDVASIGDCAGAVFSGSREEAAARIEAALRANGWEHACDADGDAEGLYRKSSGSYAWAFVQCCEPMDQSVCVTVSLWRGGG